MLALYIKKYKTVETVRSIAQKSSSRVSIIQMFMQKKKICAAKHEKLRYKNVWAINSMTPRSGHSLLCKSAFYWRCCSYWCVNI